MKYLYLYYHLLIRCKRVKLVNEILILKYIMNLYYLLLIIFLLFDFSFVFSVTIIIYMYVLYYLLINKIIKNYQKNILLILLIYVCYPIKFKKKYIYIN